MLMHFSELKKNIRNQSVNKINKKNFTTGHTKHDKQILKFSIGKKFDHFHKNEN